MSGPETVSGTGRVAKLQDWPARTADTALGRPGLRWFRAYFEASRNSAAAATNYSVLSIFPPAMAGIAYFGSAGGDSNAFATRLIEHLRLTGQTADLVREMFGTASSNALAATVAAVAGFLLWGVGIGQIVQGLYARAWKISVGSSADQGLFAIWFFVVAGCLALLVVAGDQLRAASWAGVVALWLVGST